MKATITDIRIAGLAAAVPENRHSFLETPEFFGTVEEARRVCEAVGVLERRVGPPDMCVSDLCVPAAERLLADLGWAPSSVEVLIFMTQGPDYLLPATACLIQKRLGLPKSCAAFDVTLGCSSYPYGVWLASQLLAGSQSTRALVLCGDMNTQGLNGNDQAARPLFGDAGTATALERAPGAPPIHVVVGTDGTGGEHISIRSGGARNNVKKAFGPRTSAADLAAAVAQGGEAALALYNGYDLRLNGPEVFAFTLRTVPALVRDALAFSGATLDDIDYCVMHQANRFILEHLRGKMKIPPEKFVIDMEKFGNTSSASIPLAICDRLGEELANGTRTLLLGGFGVGWSWGALVAPIGPIPRPAMIDVPNDSERLPLYPARGAQAAASPQDAA